MAEHGAEAPPASKGAAQAPGATSNTAEDESFDGEGIATDIVFVISGMLLLGIVTRSLFARLPVPYTVLLLVSPLALGSLACKCAQQSREERALPYAHLELRTPRGTGRGASRD